MIRTLLVAAFFSAISFAQNLSVVATPAALSFSAPYTAQGFSLSGASTGVIITTSQPWLSVNIPASNALPPVVAASVNVDGLANGAYTGTITIQPTSGTVGSAIITVSLTVGGGSVAPSGATLAFPSLLNFTSASGALPPSQSIALIGTIGTTFATSVHYTSPSGWLSLSRTSGTITGQGDAIGVSVSNPLLPPGFTYAAFVQVEVPEQPIQVVLVKYTPGVATTSVTPPSLTFNYIPGQDVPGTQTFTIRTAAQARYSTAFTQISGTAAGTWVANPSDVGETNPTATITVALNSAVVRAMGPGTYHTLVGVGFLFDNQPQQLVLLTLNIIGTGTGSGGTSFFPSQVILNYNQGGEVPANQTVTFYGPTASTIVLTPDPNAAWLMTGPNTTTLAPTVEGFSAGVTVGIVPGSLGNLAPGTYRALVAVARSGTAEQIATLPVVLNIYGSSAREVTPDRLTFTYEYGKSDPPPQLINIRTAGGAQTPITFQATGGYWIQATGENTAPTQLTVKVNDVGTLGPGTHTAEVKINVGDPPALVVPVTLIVSSSPQLRLSAGYLEFTSATGNEQFIDITTTNSLISYTTGIQTVSGGSWLSASPAFELAPVRLSIKVNTSGLASGVYLGTVTLNYTGGSIPIPVKLTVTGQ